jgi:hypothetical protein
MRHFTRHPIVTAIAALAFFAVFQTHATVRAWPGAAPCDTTLQNCISGSTLNDTVSVHSNGPIDEDLDLGTAMNLIAAPGYRPVLSAGRGITMFYGPGLGVNWSVLIDGFTLTQGNIGIRAYTGNPTITLRHLDITSVTGSLIDNAAIVIDHFNTTGHLVYDIEQNHIRLNSPSGLRGIELSSSEGGPFDGSIHDNRVESLSTSDNDTGVVVIGTPSSAPNVRVYSNQFVGDFATGLQFWVGTASKVTLVSNLFETHAPGFTFGLSLTLANGSSLAASIFNNTIVGFYNGILVNGAITGSITNNLFANDTPQAIHQQSGAMTEDHSLFFNSPMFTTLGTGSITANPLFRRGVDDVRLSSASPAIDVGDGAALTTLLANASLPSIDADGLRRFKRTTVDIGAFEYGDSSAGVTVSAANAGAIDDATLNGNTLANPLLTQTNRHDSYAATATDPHLVSLSYAAPHYLARSEASNAAPVVGSAYNAFSPGAGDGSFLHVTSAAMDSGPEAQIDDPYLNSHPERIVLATHRGAVAFNHPYELTYGFGSWFIKQLDWNVGDADFPSGLGFDIYAQDPSLNAFTRSAPITAATSPIDHILLNGVSCGQLVVSNLDNNLAPNPHPVGVVYAQGTWSVVNLDGAAIPAGATFSVVVDEAATSFCRYDHIFHDGVDGG